MRLLRQSSRCVELFISIEGVIMKKIILSLVVGSMFLLAGCAGPFSPDMTVYASEQGRDNKPKGVAFRVHKTRMLPFEYEDVYAAATKAVMRTGFEITENDSSKGRILAYGQVYEGACAAGPINIVVAVQVKPVPNKAQTHVTIVTDGYKGVCFGSVKHSVVRVTAQNIFADLQKILSAQ